MLRGAKYVERGEIRYAGYASSLIVPQTNTVLHLKILPPMHRNINASHPTKKEIKLKNSANSSKNSDSPISESTYYLKQE